MASACLELDGLRLRVNLLALLANVLEDLGRQRCSGLRAQTDEVLSAEGAHRHAHGNGALAGPGGAGRSNLAS